MHVTAEADEIIRALQVILPAAEASIVAEVIVAGERLGEFTVATAIDARVRHNRTIVRTARRSLRTGRRRNETTLIGPVRWKLAHRVGRTQRAIGTHWTVRADR